MDGGEIQHKIGIWRQGIRLISLSEEQKRKIDAEKFLGIPEELELIGDEKEMETDPSEKAGGDKDITQVNVN